MKYTTVQCLLFGRLHVPENLFSSFCYTQLNVIQFNRAIILYSRVLCRNAYASNEQPHTAGSNMYLSISLYKPQIEFSIKCTYAYFVIINVNALYIMFAYVEQALLQTAPMETLVSSERALHSTQAKTSFFHENLHFSKMSAQCQHWCERILL